MSKTFSTIRLATIAATLAAALAGGIASAHAQAAGGGNGNGNGGGPGGNGGDPSAVLIYGQPGNCPPSVACGPRHPPRFYKTRPSEACGDYRVGGRLWIRCMREQ